MLEELKDNPELQTKEQPKNKMYRSPVREPLTTGNKDLHDITVDIARPIETSANKWWWSLFIVSAIAMLWGFGCIAYTIELE